MAPCGGPDSAPRERVLTREDCPLCNRFDGLAPDPGGPLIETELVRAQHAAVPDQDGDVYMGWLLVTPLRHVTSLAELTPDEAEEMGRARTRLALALRESSAQHVYAMVIGDQVPHVHEHVIARWPDCPQEHFGPLRVLEWPCAPRLTEEGLWLFAARLRERLQVR